MKKLVMLFTLPFLLSCNKGKMTFLKLEKQSEEGIYNYAGNAIDSLNGKKFIYETYLVDNKIDDKLKLEAILLNFNREKYEKILKSKIYVTYYIDFYKKNSTTEYFIDHEEDPGGFSSNILSDNFKEDGIAKIYIDKINDKKCVRKIHFSDEEEFRVIDTIAIK
jgi:hypothetical protein